MKKNLLTFATAIVLLLLPNFSNAQFGVELNYGLNGSYQPSYSGLTHFGGGINYDFDDTFGAKIDFASDKFSIKNTLGTETGTSNTRISLQGVLNISNIIDERSFYNDFEVLAHAGAGMSILKSDIPNFTGTDHVVNVIVGINPQYKVAEGFYLGIDASFIANISQHYNFDGTSTYVGDANSITGLMYNLSATLSYKFNTY